MRKTKRRLLYKKEMKEAIDILLSLYPDSRSELDFTNHLELLVATILSAQCTDVRVNLVTPALFSVAKTARDYAEMDPKELEGLIKTCGLYKSKAKNIQLTARILDEEYGGICTEPMAAQSTAVRINSGTLSAIARLRTVYFTRSGCKRSATASRPSIKRGPGREIRSALIVSTRSFSSADRPSYPGRSARISGDTFGSPSLIR
jgi:hypothetical protein